MSTSHSASSKRLSFSSFPTPVPLLLLFFLLLISSESGLQTPELALLPALCWALLPSQLAPCLQLLCLQCLHHLSFSSRSCGSCFRLDRPHLFPGLLKFLAHHLFHYTVSSEPPATTPITRLISQRCVYDHFAHSLITSQCLLSEAQVPKLGVQGPAKYSNNQ